MLQMKRRLKHLVKKASSKAEVVKVIGAYDSKEKTSDPYRERHRTLHKGQKNSSTKAKSAA